MVNAAKCSGDDESMKMVPAALYERCKQFGRQELGLLMPEVVIAQGARARAMLPKGERIENTRVSELARAFGLDQAWLVDWLHTLVSRYLRWIHLSDARVLAMLTPHPASRAGQWQHFELVDLRPLVQVVRGLVGLDRAA